MWGSKHVAPFHIFAQHGDVVNLDLAQIITFHGGQVSIQMPHRDADVWFELEQVKKAIDEVGHLVTHTDDDFPKTVVGIKGLFKDFDERLAECEDANLSTSPAMSVEDADNRFEAAQAALNKANEEITDLKSAMKDALESMKLLHAAHEGLKDQVALLQRPVIEYASEF